GTHTDRGRRAEQAPVDRPARALLTGTGRHGGFPSTGRHRRGGSMTQTAAEECKNGIVAPTPIGPFRRVVLKLSGEEFGGGQIGVDPEVVRSIARQIVTVVRGGGQLAGVVGGGNLSRRSAL